MESNLLVTDFSSNHLEMAYIDKPSIIYVPGLDDVYKSHKNYHLDKLTYPNMFYCKTMNEMFAKIKKTLKDIKDNRAEFNFASKLFKYVDTNNTQRLVEWMLEQVKRRPKNTTPKNPVSYMFKYWHG